MPHDRLARHEKIAFEKWEGYAKAIERGSADWARLLALIGLEPRGLRGQDYTVHFLREGGVEG